MNNWDIDSIFPVPEHPIDTIRDWTRAENELRYTLPDDYKAIVEKYGTFNIDSFMWIFNPFAQNRNVNLLIQTISSKKIFDNIKHDVSNCIPYEYPDIYDLINWASTDNGDRLYWLINRNTNKWIIAINETRTIEWQDFDMTTTEFLFKLLTKQIHINAFPDTFPCDNPNINYLR
jgi:uncharacterized protein involved in tolerance to divalent cations